MDHYLLTTVSADSSPYNRVRNRDTTNDPTMQKMEIYVLMIVTEPESWILTEGTARKLMSTATITVD
jgi:hypothetical protein